METAIGIVFLFWGIIGGILEWLRRQRIRENRLEEIELFLKKTMFAMETEHIKIIPYFLQYQSRDKEFKEILTDVAVRLQENRYPKGEMAWEEVFMEKRRTLDLEEETFRVILHAGNGLFGKYCTENLRFLQKSIADIENQKQKNKEKDAKERKVWIPVGMLSGVMIVILFI